MQGSNLADAVANHMKPLALLANYSLHYVGGTRANEISADYFAVFAAWA